VIKPASGFHRDATRSVQSAPVDRATLDEDRTKPRDHLGGVLNDRGNDGLEAHNGVLSPVDSRKK